MMLVSSDCQQFPVCVLSASCLSFAEFMKVVFGSTASLKWIDLSIIFFL